MAGLAARLGIATLKGAVSFGFVAWIAFPVILLSGSVFHENVPCKLAAIHAGDWLLKLVIMTVIVSVWPRKLPRKQRRAATRPVVRG